MKKIKLSLVIPCYNEESTLKECVEKVLCISNENLTLEIIIVDDGSTDESLNIAKCLEKEIPQVLVIEQKKNKGKGAALREGFKKATGDFIAVQDADLEYDPKDLKRLLIPLINNKADVVVGSRFLTVGPHRVLYYWHSIGNKILTSLSNIFTDLNLTDMEAGYKVFKAEVIKNINIEENRFGFEPEIIAKISHSNLRIYEMGVSYFGRTYEEGKKINYKDGLRAFYCIFKYNAYKLPAPTHFLLYFLIGIFAVIFNLLLFKFFYSSGMSFALSIPLAFSVGAAINFITSFYFLYLPLKKVKSYLQIVIYFFILIALGFIDYNTTKSLYLIGIGLSLSKIIASVVILILNLAIRKLWLNRKYKNE